MKLSEISRAQIKDFCGISGDESDDMLDVISAGTRSFIAAYTGISAEELDGYADISMAFLVLVNEMFTNRTLTVDSANLNPYARQILDLHCRNLL